MITDPQLAEQLKAYYRFLCKRPLSSDTFYPCFNQPNVTLVDTSNTQGLERITEKGFVQDGVEYEIDCIIFASGFAALLCTLVVGWPIHYWLGRVNKRSLLAYLGSAMMAGVAFGLLGYVASGLLIEWFVWTIPMGLLTALFAWLIRRPDRDQPTPPSNTTSA